jgi:acyl dehydratase
MSGEKMKLEVGRTATRTLTITPEMVEMYARITGDFIPLHFDEAFAAATPFGRLVVQGGITAGILNALVAEDLPGPGTVFMSQQLEYTAPVFIGDTITGMVEILKVHETKPVTHLRVEVRRSTDEIVLKGEAWCYTFPGPL